MKLKPKPSRGHQRVQQATMTPLQIACLVALYLPLAAAAQYVGVLGPYDDVEGPQLPPAASAYAEPQGVPAPHAAEEFNPSAIESIELIPKDDISMGEYEHAIKALRSQHGAYDHRLSEQLLGLGIGRRAQGDHAAAVEALEQSLHISRINQGLHNIDQLPVVDLLIDSHRQLANWEGVDRYYHYLHWVNRRGRDASDPAYIQTIHRYAAWNLTAYELETDQPPFVHLANAESALAEAKRVIETHYGSNDPRLLDTLYAQAITNLYMASYVSRTYDTSVVRSTSARFSANPARREIQDALDRQNYIAQRYRIGRNALKRAVEIQATSSDATARARALAHLGDWNNLFGRRQTAKKYYAEAYDALQANGVPEEHQEAVLGHPVALPALRLKSANELTVKSEDASKRAYVVTAFDVTSSGRVRNIRVVETSPVADEKMQRQARRILKNTRFRPRIENGRPITTSGVQLRYVFPEEKG